MPLTASGIMFRRMRASKFKHQLFGVLVAIALGISTIFPAGALAAVSGTNLTSAADVDGGTTSTTASITPTGNDLVIACVAHQVLSGTVATPTLSGNGITWTQVATRTDTGVLRRITLFRGMVASPTTGAVTIDFGGQSQLRSGWNIVQFSGIDTGGSDGSAAVVQSATNAQSDASPQTGITVTLAAFGSTDNATFGCLRYGASASGANLTEGSGFTSLAEVASTSSYASEYKASNDTSVDWTWDSSSTFSQAIAIEIKAAAASVYSTLHSMFLSF